MRPPDPVIVMALGLSTYRERLFGGGPDASERVAGMLRELGHPCRSQQCAAWLHRLARIELPPVVVHQPTEDRPWHTYAVTAHGRTWVHNRLYVELPA